MDHEGKHSRGVAIVYRWVVAHRLQVITLTFWALVLLIVQNYLVSEGVPLETLAKRISELLQVNFWGPFILFILYGLRPLTLMPSSLLTVLAGSIFGFFPGFVYALVGGVLSSLLPYWAGYLGFGKANPNPSGTRNNLLRQLVTQVREHPFQAVFASRLLYPPYDLVNFLFGSMRVPFLPYVLATLTGNVIGAFAYIGIGASIEGNIEAGALEVNTSLLLISMLVLVVSVVIMWGLRVHASRRLPDDDATHKPDSL